MSNIIEEEEILIAEIPDEDIIWETELQEVYIERNVEFMLDDLVNDFYTFCYYMFLRAGFNKPTKIQEMIINFVTQDSNGRYKMIQAPRGA